MLAEVVDLVFARQGHVARRGDDLDLGCQYLERQVEAHLVVAGARRAVGHAVGADRLGVFDDGDGLENTLRADRNGVGAVAQDVAVDHVFDALFVVFLLDVERGVLHGAQRQGAFFDVRKLLLREAARVGDGRIDIVPFILGEVFHAERGVETSAECQNYFLLSHFLISFCLFQVEQFFELVFEEHDVGRHARLYLRGFLGRVVEHTRAEAHAPVVALQDVVVAAALATPPELLVLGDKKGGVYIMKNLEELVSLYLEQSDGGKSYTNNAKSLRTWARQNNANVTIDSLLQWINNGVRKTTKPKNKIGFINHFIRFLNSRGIHTIVPLRNSRKIQPIRRNPEEQPLKISAASDLLEKYIVHMRTAGALSNTTHQCLRFFNNHCAANYPITSKLTEEMILSWCSKRETECPASFNKRIAPIRSFLHYVNKASDEELPLPEYLPYDKKKFIPHAFSQDELRNLFENADLMEKMTHYRGYAFRIRRMTLSVILRFLYSTGLRTCEARLLTREDVDLQDGVVNISKSKGINQHRIALHPSLWDLLRQYDDAVTRYIPNRKAFFPNEFGDHFSRTWLPYHFSRLWTMFSDAKARIYDLRSNYAVTNINKWKYVGPEWFDKLLYLSRTMGHTTIKATAYYYNLVPLFADQLNELSGSGLTEILPDLTDYYTNEEE